ncbi:hypothetical protein [Shinella zoogloeoides]
MSRQWVRTFSLVGFLLGALAPVHAVELEKIAGHTVEIREKDFEKVLVVDGRELHTNQIVFLDDVYAFGDTVALVGTSSGGGNACDGAPFVLSFPGRGAPRIDGPIDSCVSVSWAVEGAGLVFSTVSVPGRETERWQWTAERGIAPLASVAFQADAASGWANLRERTFTHPSDAFGNGEIAASLKMVLGSDFEHFQTLMTGVGSGEFKGDDFVGTACRPHACLDEAGLIFLSSGERRAYAAWKPDGGKIAVFPAPVKDWPEKARAELREWAKQWP